MQETTNQAPVLGRSSEWLAAEASTATLWWMLRIAAAMCFIGHGAFGIIGKSEWLPYFAAFGIGSDAAWNIMPLIGSVDIAMGILVLLAPTRAVFVWMTVWALWTAALRPLAGESVFEMIERAGNYGVPLALLVMAGLPLSMRGWLGLARPEEQSPGRERTVRLVLAWATALLLAGHGALAAIERKPLLLAHADAIGVSASTAVAAGWLEIALAVVVLARPRAGLLVGIVLWKLGTEMLYTVAGAPIWEVIERGGSYGAPLGLALLAWRRPRRTDHAFPGVAAPESGAMPQDVPAARSASRGIARFAAGLGFAAMASVAGANLADAQQATASESREAGRLEGAALVDALRRGGLVFAFRHTQTDNGRDTGPSREEQRNLTEHGEHQARDIGEAIRALGVPIGEVRSSWMHRTLESARLAFGKVQIDSSLRGRGAVDGLRAGMVAPVEPGENRVLLSHNGVFVQVLRGHGIERLAEGDIAVVEPLGEAGFRVVAHLRPEDWQALVRAR